MESNNRFELENLSFPPEFFRDEVREGFYIATMMKRYWAAQLKVLSHIARICKAHGIRWFADCGSLIGAVRHEGYIPWDDDLDICMLRSDWLRFFEIAAKELPAEYEVLTIKSQKEYAQIIGRIVNSHAIDYGPQHMADFYGCPYTVGIDVFPLDGVYDDPEKEDDRKKRAQAVLKELKLLEEKGLETSGRYRELIIKIEELYSECSSDDSENVALMPFFIPENNHKYPKDLFEHPIKLPFENTYINVPARYEEVLTIEYGDFMHVVKGGGIHEYPVYSAQQETLKKAFGHNPYAYTLNYNELIGSVQRYAKKLVAQGEKSGKKVVALLPCRAMWWGTIEPLWRYYVSRPEEYDVHVLPVFFFDCDFGGNVGEKHDERNLFPEEVKVEPCENFDFAGIHPDIIVTQVPFDGFNTSFTLHEFFYSGNLLNFTDELIYVPCYDVDDPLEEGDKAEAAIKTLIEQQAVINSDRVILATEKLKDMYIGRLLELTGEDTRSYWLQKIATMAEYCGEEHDTESRAPKHYLTDSCDEDWLTLVGDNNRKIMVYYFTISFLMQGQEKAIDKISRSLNIFEEAGDSIIAVIVPQNAILSQLREIDQALWNKLEPVLNTISERKNCVLDNKGIALNNMSKWNAFYGDRGAVAHKCIEMGIPVMIENLEI